MNETQGATPLNYRPLVSVIVPTFNRGRYLERCIRSILDQTYRELECIVIDAASKDDSVEILQRLSAKDPRLKFISEPDSGEVDALNKGIALAKGEIVGQQASDDFYVPDAIASSVEFLMLHPDVIGVAGDALYVDETGKGLGRGVITHRGTMSAKHIKHILRVRYKSCLVCHGSFFGWRERLLHIGKFDPAFSVVPDWEFYLRVLTAGERIGCLPKVQYMFSVHSDMGAVKHQDRVEIQRRALHQTYGMKWYDEIIRSTVGRALNYFSNPYRSRLVPGLRREIKDAWIRRIRR